jgi:uncharacterized protein YjbI with pentapeptide repeats
MTPTKQSWAQRARASNWVFVAEMVAIVVTVAALGIATAGLWEQVRVNKDTTLAHNWTLLTTLAPGNSGKVKAMQYLASKKQPLDGIDLSCEAMNRIVKYTPDEENSDEETDSETVEETDSETVKNHSCKPRVYLRSLDLSEATHSWRVSLRDANLRGANLWGANLSGAILSGANLSGTDLGRANLSGAFLLGANLSGTLLYEADLSGADLTDTNLSDAILLGAHLSGANLSDADFNNALGIYSADFTDAWAWVDSPPLNLPVEIDLCVYQDDLDMFSGRPDACIILGEDLSGADLSGAIVWDVDLNGRDLSGANLSGADLKDANLSDAILWDANLSGANLQLANLSGADLTDADLSGANLSNADFKDALGIESADFTDAWAWADRPPRNLPSNIYDAIDLCVFQDGLNPYERPDPCIAPSE